MPYTSAMARACDSKRFWWDEKSTGTNTSRSGRAVGRGPFAPMVSTGCAARRTTSCATLPITSRSTPRRPWVPITMRSTSCSSA